MRVDWLHKQAVLALVLAAGCVPGSALRPDDHPLQTEVGTFYLAYAPAQAQGAARVRAAIQKAGPLLVVKWGKLQEPVTVRIQPDHRTLELAAGSSGFAWLRAWTRYAVMDVEAPESWQPIPATQQALEETMLHELTHALMYQAAADLGGWRQKKIPEWFREGMASYTADQGYRWPPLEQLARTLEEHPEWEPLVRPDPLSRDQMPLVYGAAHHAFSFLVSRYGEETVRTLLKDMSQGPDFPGAFTAAVGIPPDAFLRDFERYLRLRGFKGGRLLHPSDPPP